MNNKPMFSASMLGASTLNLMDDIKVIDNYIDYYHVDVMDGHYVPNFAFSPDYVKKIKKVVSKPIDCHLMVERPLDFIDSFIDAGADMISLHPDTINKCAFRTINYIKSKGIKFGVALLPSDNIEILNQYIHLIDKIIVMTVDPGFGGQKPILDVLPKLTRLKELKKEKGYKYILEIDGGCSDDTFEIYKQSGCEMFVLGSGLFNKPDLKKGIEQIIDKVNKL